MRSALSALLAPVLLAHVVCAETVPLPPVVVQSLVHQYTVDPGPPVATTSMDAVQFPCAPGNCSGPGFSASIGIGDTIVVRYAAPVGQRFQVAYAPGGTQQLFASSQWTTGILDGTSNFPIPTITFEGLSGPAPTNTYALTANSNNGEMITCTLQFTVTASCSFTALRVDIPVPYPTVDIPRTFGPVDSNWSPSFGCLREVLGTASDVTLMSIVPDGVTLPPVLVSTLAHDHFVNTIPLLQTITRDSVQFPCTGGACSGPGFSASIGQGDRVVIRFTAPTGHQFVVRRAPGGTQFFWATASWQTGTSDVISNFPPSTVTFGGLTGTAPTNSYSLGSISDNGQAIVVDQQYVVSGDFSFTEMRIEFTVGHALAAQLRTYGSVNSTSSPSFASARIVSGSATDTTVMSIEPIAPSQAFCFGDGNDTSHTTACPCGNTGAATNGCANSVNPAGANLSAAGTANPDTIVLQGSGMPANVVCIYIQQDARGDSVFGDGVSCASGNLIRLRAKTNVGGASQFPDGTDTLTVSQRGGVTPGSGVLRYYAGYYRNAAAAFCPPLTYNITNGWIIRW